GVLGNYNITYNTASFTINPRPITVTANPQTKVYGEADPALTFTVGGSGLAFSDTILSAFTGSLTRAPGETVTGSPYAIGQGTLAASANYTVSFSGSGLTIT